MKYFAIASLCVLSLVTTATTAAASNHDSNYSQSPIWDTPVHRGPNGEPTWVPARETRDPHENVHAALSSHEQIRAGERVMVPAGTVMRNRELGQAGLKADDMIEVMYVGSR